MSVKPETELDVMVLFNEKAGLKENEFEEYFEVQETEKQLFVNQKKGTFLKRPVWLKLYELVKGWDGKYEVGPPRRFVIPIERKQKESIVETATPTKIEAPKIKMPPESEGTMRLEDLKVSESNIGQIFPVVKDQFGNILDGFHRKRVNPNWKETTVEVADPLHALRIRVHSNLLRRNIPWSEKHRWVMDARKLLNPSDPMEPSQEQVANAIGMSKPWVKKYDRVHGYGVSHVEWKERFYGYNVWGFKDESWRKHIVPNDPNQPDKEFYHGSTPAFVIHQLIKMFQPKLVLDNMAGVGTTGYVCTQYPEIECEQFDIYPYEKHNVKQGDAEFVQTDKSYDLIFNHIPYLGMAKYGENPNDLSTMKEAEFFAKLQRIFKKNYELLKDTGVFVVLVGDWRSKGRLVPLIANVTMLGLNTNFVLYDEAVKLTAEQKSTGLQEYRATQHGYLAQTFDVVLIFRKGG